MNEDIYLSYTKAYSIDMSEQYPSEYQCSIIIDNYLMIMPFRGIMLCGHFRTFKDIAYFI
jgi:hypothetical protein